VADDLTRLLGRKQEHDEQSRRFMAPVAATVKTVLHTAPPTILDQGHWYWQAGNRWVGLGSCTGNAHAHLRNMRPFRKPRTRYCDQNDAVRFYSRGTQLDPWPGWFNPETCREDTGSSGLAVAKGAHRDAEIGGYTWLFGYDQGVAGLQLGPLSVGVDWYEGMMQPNNKGFIEPTGDQVGGHQLVWIGHNERDQYETLLNSWSTGWGLRGRARISSPHWRQLIAQGGDIHRIEPL
jgi:hypothetical protein